MREQRFEGEHDFRQDLELRAVQEARRLGDREVKSVHLLLALVKTEGSDFATSCETYGVKPEAIEKELCAFYGSRSKPLSPEDEIELTPRVRTIFNRAVKFASQRGASNPDLRDIAESFLTSGDSVSLDILSGQGVNLESLRRQFQKTSAS